LYYIKTFCKFGGDKKDILPYIHYVRGIPSEVFDVCAEFLVDDINNKVDIMYPQGVSSFLQVLKGAQVALSGLKAMGVASSTPDVPYIGVVKTLISVMNLYEHGLTFTTIASLLLDLYQIFDSDFARPQSLEALSLGALALLLPKELFNILKNISVLTSAKVMDDVTGFSALFNHCVDFLVKTLEAFPNKVSVPLVRLIKSLPFGSHYLILGRIDKVMMKWKKDKVIILSQVFREEVKEIAESLDNAALQEWVRRSNAVKAKLADFQCLVKALKAYDSTSRVEPLCFVFEGGPGTMKSITMNQLIKSFRTTTYGHTVKASGDGKDFYDTYANQRIFYMDDLGQQGISQFRNLINWVSSVKFPLECAAAELKDTKYFSSSLIMFTTNRFTELNGLVKSDCIDNVEALWRRGFVFDFNKVKRKRSTLTGTIVFKHYDMVTKRWVEGFPPEMDPGVSPSFRATNIRADHLRWMHTIISYMEQERLEQESEQDLTEEEIDSIQRGEDSPPEETYEDAEEAQGPTQVLKDKVETAMEYCTKVEDNMWSMMWMFEDMVMSAASTIWENIPDWKTNVVSLCIIAGIAGLYYGLTKVKPVKVEYSLAQTFKQATDAIAACEGTMERRTTQVESVAKQCLFLKLQFPTFHTESIAIVSGHSVVVPAHLAEEDFAQVTVYKDVTAQSILWDHIPMTRVYMSVTEDVAIYQANVHIPTPFKCLSHLFKAPKKVVDVLVTPIRSFDLCSISREATDVKYAFDIRGVAYVNHVKANRGVNYKLEAPGLCGSPIMSSDEGVCGIHVAGGDNGGTAVLWSNSVIEAIRVILAADKMFHVKADISDKIVPDFSAIKLENTGITTSSSGVSKIVPSPLATVFESTKAPANLRANGPFTVKDIAKKSFTPVQAVDVEDLKFAKGVIGSFLPPFTQVSVYDAIKGDPEIAGMNKKSSCGYGFVGEKAEYIDFEKGTLTAKGGPIYSKFLDKIDAGEFDLDDNVWTECLKDELRPLHKVDVPRSFRCSTWMIQLLSKQLFTNMVKHIVKNRHENQIMVGINPLREFKHLDAKLRLSKKKWAGDFKKWDGGMLPQIQHAIADVIKDHFKGDAVWTHRLSFILASMPHTVVSVANTLFQVNHSMPSGHFLTAIFNSLVNRALTAMWYHNVMISNVRRPSYSEFLSIVDYVYGDDKLNGVSSHSDILHMKSMASYFSKLGLGFTTADKKEVTVESEDMDQLSFLKRTFVFDPRCGTIVCPLDINTIISSIAWYDKTKDMTEVLAGKLDAFQREAFLHADKYDELIRHAEEKLRDLDFHHVFRSKEVLLHMLMFDKRNFLPIVYDNYNLNV
jgi:hypothetical protein